MSELAQEQVKGGREQGSSWYRLLVERRDVSLLITIIIAALAISRFTPYFLTWMNMRTLGLAVAFNGIVVIGMTILMVSGGMDLSVGATYGLSSIIVALLIAEDFPVVPGILLGLVVGVFIGLLNSVLINRFLLSPFLATLGTMSVLRSMIWVVSGGHSVVGLPRGFRMLGQTKLLELQLPVYIMLVFVILADFLMRRSTFLRQMYYIGNNRDSARSAGIPVSRVTGIAYVLSAVLAAVAGILDGARVGAVYVQAGLGLEFQVITAAVIGGTSLDGGKGTIFGSLLGVIVMAMLTNVLNLVGVDPYWQSVLVGVILVAVVALDRLVTPKEVR
jgi:ribose transport system permease protein